MRTDTIEDGVFIPTNTFAHHSYEDMNWYCSSVICAIWNK